MTIRYRCRVDMHIAPRNLRPKQQQQQQQPQQQPQQQQQQQQQQQLQQQGNMQVATTFCVGDFSLCLYAVDMEVDSGCGAAHAKACSDDSDSEWLRHERLSVAMALAESQHHTSRGQKKARAGGRSTRRSTRRSSGSTPPPRARHTALYA